MRDLDAALSASRRSVGRRSRCLRGKCTHERSQRVRTQCTSAFVHVRKTNKRKATATAAVAADGVLQQNHRTATSAMLRYVYV